MNPLSILPSFFGKGVLKFTVFLSCVALFLWIFDRYGYTYIPLSFIFWSSLIVLSSIIIWRAGDFFSPAARFIENRYNLPQSVKAAVIDAIASSFPEFAVAVIAVIIIGRAEIGIATIVGSALYNVLVIPAAIGIVAISPVMVSKEVIWRDNLVYIGVVVILLVVIQLFPLEWGIGIALLFLAVYLGYILLLHTHYKKYKKRHNNSQKDEKVITVEKHKIASAKEAWAWIIGMMLLMGLGSHMLVEASIALGALIGVHQVVMAFIVIAAGTSVPDMVLSIISSRQGQYDAAISNVFGSNIFDICVCLSIPIILSLLLNGDNTPINLPQVSLVWLLLGSTLIAFAFFRTNNYTLTRVKAWLLGVLYVLVIVYALILS